MKRLNIVVHHVNMNLTQEKILRSPHSSVNAFLSMFKKPAPSCLARKRRCHQLARNGRTENDPKRVSEADRIKQFPNEPCPWGNSGLELFTKKSILEMHTKGKEVLNLKQMTIGGLLETLCQPQLVFFVCSAFLKAGIPLYKIDKLRGILESGGYSLSHSTHLRQLIPFISVKMDIGNSFLESIIFDGTTHVAEAFVAFVVVVRYVDSEWVISQKVLQSAC